MTDYSTPITDKDLAKAKTWYDIVCWGGLRFSSSSCRLASQT